MYTSGSVVGVEELKAAVPKLFMGDKTGDGEPLFISGGREMHVNFYDGNGGERREEVSSPCCQKELCTASPVYQALLRLFYNDLSEAGEAMKGLSLRANTVPTIKHHPPIGRQPSKKATALRLELRHMSLEGCLEIAGL